jgi:hypothetical protein
MGVGSLRFGGGEESVALGDDFYSGMMARSQPRLRKQAAAKNERRDGKYRDAFRKTVAQ